MMNMQASEWTMRYNEKKDNNDIMDLGHYITLIGYDHTEDLFIYRDPAVVDSYCTITADEFDAARQSDGTDNDW